jgi:serine protease inhibitor
MQRIALLSVLLAFALTLGLGVTGVKGVVPVSKSESESSSQNLAERQAEFSFELFARIVETDFGENIFISPTSALLALAMTYAGAGGETKAAMAEALELAGIDRNEAAESLGKLAESLENIDPEVELNIANSVWAKKGLRFKMEFFETVGEYFDAEMRELTDAGEINRWVSKETKEKIKSIIDRIRPEDIMVLINAIYFKGMWTSKFDSADTRELDFTLLDGSKKKHPLMTQSDEFRYYETEDFQAVSLPYGNKKLSMYVFLPSQQLGLRQFLADLDAENWRTWLRMFRKTEGDITLPRFKLEYERELNDVLKALGMEIAFNPTKADFSGMYEISPDQNVFISKVKQKTYVEVNEEGTEAAAVTSVTMTLTSAMGPSEKFTMIVDRPFFCVIYDEESGTPLFMGAVVDP